jgi:hypothetical protein
VLNHHRVSLFNSELQILLGSFEQPVPGTLAEREGGEGEREGEGAAEGEGERGREGGREGGERERVCVCV